MITNNATAASAQFGSPFTTEVPPDPAAASCCGLGVYTGLLPKLEKVGRFVNELFHVVGRQFVRLETGLI
jgi:hypothetical protein